MQSAAERWRPSRRLVIALSIVLALGVIGSGLYAGLRGAGLFFVDRLPVRFVLPQPTGSFPVGTTELHLVDQDRADPWVAGRKRELMVSVWYPASETDGYPLASYMPARTAKQFSQSVLGPVRLAERVDIAGVRTHAWSGAPAAAGSGPWPVILYSPGGNLPRAMGTTLVQDLASRGYVVVTIDHTYEAIAVEFPDGRVALRSLPEMEGRLQKMNEVRVADARFVLDQLEVLTAGGDPDAHDQPLPEALGAALDLSRVGMFGHSAGGFAAAETMLADPRVDAGINLDGSMAYSMSRGEYGESVARGLERPFMLFGAGASGGPTRPHTHEWAPDWKIFWENSTGWKLDLYMLEGEHFTFSDYQVVAPQLVEKTFLPGFVARAVLGTVDPERAIAAQRAYIAAFFDQHLKGEDQSLLRAPSPLHPDVDFIR